MAFEELKTRQSVVWGSGPYERVSEQHLHALEQVVERVAPTPGTRLLDVATGTGELARIAARTGAEVTGIDLAPGLIESALQRTDGSGLRIRFDVGDAENLPYADGSFDITCSTFGVMFAPDHRAAADELARVTRRGGKIGLATWVPEGGVAEMFRVMSPFQPTPPPGVGNPFDWGSPEHVTELLGHAFDLTFDQGEAPHVGSSGEEMWELMSTAYGPTKVLADNLDETRRTELHAAFVDLYERHRSNGLVVLPRSYLLTIGSRR